MELLYYLVVPWVGVKMVFVCHLLLARRTRLGFLESLLSAIGIGTALAAALQLVVTLIVYPLPAPDAAGYAIVNIIIYLALLYIYINFVNMGETARRVRLLRELSAVAQGLSREELLARYNAREIVTKRLERLCATGQVVRGSDGLFKARRGSAMLRTARVLRAAKILLLGRSGRLT
jgi:hypothetical protein